MADACPRCHTQCVSDAQFCHRCGCPLATDAIPDSPSSGTPAEDQSVARAMRRLMPEAYVDRLVAGKGRVAGERRIVTILFSDIKGSTAMAENLDPEEVLEIMNGAFEVLIAPVTRYEGTLARLMGDAILAFFGAPVAHEDDPKRACLSALEILAGVKDYALKLEKERGIVGFNVRVGINTGLVVTGEVGTDLRVEYTAMGDAVNLAARMEAAAEPGTILVTEATWKRIRTEFETYPMAPIRVKGKRDPVHTFELVRQRVNVTAQEGSARVPVVGRTAELHVLQAGLRSLRNGTGGVVAITGEAGMGKSRLLTELRELPSSVCWAECRGSPYTTSVSFWTARALLCGLLGEQSEAAPETVGRALRSCLERSNCQESQELYTSLAMLLNLPLEPPLPGSASPYGPEEVRHRGVEAFRRFVRAKSAENPLSIVWEDLHCTDVYSLHLLESLLELGGECPVLFIISTRPGSEQVREMLSRAATSLRAKYHAIELRPLSPAESLSLASHILRGRPIPRKLRKHVIEKTEGNPLFLEELLRWMNDAAVLRSGTAGPHGMTLGDDVEIPEALQALIMSRIDRLPPEDRQVLQTASVIGRTFQRRTLDRVLESPTVATSLEELQKRDFLLVLPRVRHRQNDDQFCFRQSLMQEVAYNTLLVSQRKALHLRAGEILEDLFPQLTDDLAGVLGAHFEKAGVRDKAIRYLTKAADRASKVFANDEAIDYYLRALQLSDADATAVLHESLGDVYSVISKYSRATEHYTKALHTVTDVRKRSGISRKLGLVYEKEGLYNEAIARYQEALLGLKSEPDLLEIARVQAALGMTYYHLHRFEEAAEVTTVALDMMQQEGNRRGIAEACNTLGIIRSRLGAVEEALALHQRGLAIWQELGETSGLAASHNNLGFDYSMVSDWTGCIKHYKESLSLCKAMGNRHGVAKLYDNLGQVYARQGRNKEAFSCMKKAAALLAEISADSTDAGPEMWQQAGEW